MKTTSKQPTEGYPQEGEYSVHAKCLIRIGDKCTVFFPNKEGTAKKQYGKECYMQTAEVVGLCERFLDIRMTSGPMIGQTITRFLPEYLLFNGQFVRKL